MTIDRNDARLTAYALGEMSEQERDAFETAIAGDAEALAEVASIREMATLLEEGLASEAPRALDSGRRATIEDAARPRQDAAQVAPIARARRRKTAGLLAGAAAVAALAASTLLFVGNRPDMMAAPVEMAPVEEPPPLPMASAWSTPAGMDGAGSPIEAPKGRMASKPALRGEPSTVTADAEAIPGHNTEKYDHVTDNPFVLVAQDPRSTFSIDVDTASYSLVRRHLQDGALPPPGAVRIEEMINYFKYDYAEPSGDAPFSVNTEVSSAPWAPAHHLVRIGVKGKHVAAATRPNANLVFLLDVSGSMESPDKLPLLKQGFEMLVPQLDAGDHVSIVVYAGASGLVLPPTRCDEKRTILDALSRLEAGGSTNGGDGIRLAYQQARANLKRGGINRVILATDGDFNVGTTSQDELVRLIEEEAKSGIFLSVLGFGSGNYQDSTLEKLADKGNGNYAYIDSAAEARKVLVEQASGTLITIAKDVKIQLEMNPTKVEAFRLIGYENRVLAHRDFTNDAKDAGEIGADHTVTALYELIPKGQSVPGATSGSMLRYQQPTAPTTAAHSGELLTVKLRYKEPQGTTSRELEFHVENEVHSYTSASRDHQFAAAVASFGMLLRNSEHKGTASYGSVVDLASPSVGGDQYRSEFLQLVRTAQNLARQ